MKNKALIYTAVFSILFSTLPSVTWADSGLSAMPPKDSALHQSYYKMYAPKTQTTYKQFAIVDRKVDDVIKESDQLMVYGSDLTNASAVVAPFVAKNPIALKGVAVTSAVGGAVYFAGRFGKASMAQFKSGSIIKHKVYFKWTNPDKLEYAIKVETWVEYKGTKVSDVKTSEYRKTL